jgi:hypothetical protein
MPRTRQRSRPEVISLLERPAAEAPAQRAKSPAPEQPDTAQPAIMTLDEAAAAYEGEWALMRVTGQYEDTGQPYGEILVQHSSCREIDKVARRTMKLDPSVQLAFILGGTQRRTLEEFNALPDKGAREPYVNALW